MKALLEEADTRNTLAFSAPYAVYRERLGRVFKEPNRPIEGSKASGIFMSVSRTQTSLIGPYDLFTIMKFVARGNTVGVDPDGPEACVSA